MGADGWGWDDVLPYFLRAEHNERGASEFHGAGGPLNVAEQRSPRPLCAAFLQAAEATGIPRIADYNGPGAGRRLDVPGDPEGAAGAGARPTPICARPSSART